MADLGFSCVDVQPEDFAAAPALRFRVGIRSANTDPVHAMILRCQIRIEPRKRRYDDQEAELIAALFGDRSRWGETMNPMQFANVSVSVPSFTSYTEVDVSVPCSYDLDVATGQYFHALRGGTVPMVLLFSGTIFGKGTNGFWVEQVPWDLEASAAMPVEVWQRMMDRYFPEQGWLRLRRDTLDELLKYKAERAIPTWDAVLGELLASRREGVS